MTGSQGTSTGERLVQVLGALPGVAVHLLVSVVGWTFVQLNGLMVAGCGSQRPCDFTLVDTAVNGVQPVLVVAWLVTAVLAIARALASGRNAWPVLGIGIGVSVAITVAAYVALCIGVRVF